MYPILSSIGSVCILLISVFIYFNNTRSEVHRHLLLLGVAGFFWLFPYSLMYILYEKTAFLMMLVGYTAICFIPALLFHFTVSFLELKLRKIIILMPYMCGLLFSLMLYFTSYIVDGLVRYEWGFYPKAGRFNPIFLLYFVLLYNSCIFILFYHSKRAMMSERKQQQTKYIFLAFLVTAITSLDFLPSYGINFRPIGYLSMFGWPLIAGYAIVRYQILDIEVVIRKVAIYTGLFAAIYSVIAIFAFLGQFVFQDTTGGNRWTSLIPSIFIIVLALRPLENFLVRVTDRFLFQKKYDYRELLRTLSRDIMTIMDLDKLTTRIVEDLVNIIRLESCAILLFDKNKDIYYVEAANELKYKSITFKKDDPMITFLSTTHTHIVKGEHIERMRNENTIKEDMKKLNAEFILPLIIHDELIGILSLGMKKSGEVYNQDDTAVLEALAGTASVAVSNAQYVINTMQLEAEAAQREKMAIIGTLAAGINHEICNPLGIARGQCEVFLLNQKEGLYKDKSNEEQLAEAMKIMEKVIKETDRATSITKKLSTFAKPSKGEISEDVNIKDEVNEVFTLVSHEFKLDKIDVNINMRQDLPYITCDRKQLQQILFNILRNAGQAIGEKGAITINAEVVDDKIKIDIRDTGRGIPKDKLNDIFNPFYTTKDPGKGTGLGLFIVRQLVERNRGKIYVTSVVGQGTTFTLEFPILGKVGIYK